MLPVKADKAAKPEEGCVKQLAAIIKGSFSTCSTGDFPADCEEACKRLVSFLALWFPTTNNKKSDERQAFKQACGRLKSEEINAIVNNLHSYKSWLLRKHRNLKTGEKTDPVIKSLLQILVKPEMAEVHNNSSQSSGSKETIASTPTKPVKRLHQRNQYKQRGEPIPEHLKPRPTTGQMAQCQNLAGGEATPAQAGSMGPGLLEKAPLPRLSLAHSGLSLGRLHMSLRRLMASLRRLSSRILPSRKRKKMMMMRSQSLRRPSIKKRKKGKEKQQEMERVRILRKALAMKGLIKGLGVAQNQWLRKQQPEPVEGYLSLLRG
jgi:hypothetical protein